MWTTETRIESARVTRWPGAGLWVAMMALLLTGGGGTTVGGMAGSAVGSVAVGGGL